MKLAICLASRGLINSRTVESVLKNLEILNKDWQVKWFISHNLPIPDAQNDITQRAYDWGADRFWFVEEDEIIAQWTLDQMLKYKYHIIAVDYAVGEKKYSTIRRKNDKILWCGLGCTLITREVFDKLDKPWFRIDKSYQLKENNEFEEINVPNKYGGHDINFGLRVNELGMSIFQLPNMVCGHIKLRELGKEGWNDGIHKFEVWDKIELEQNY